MAQIIFLAKLGFDVNVFEKSEKAGGTVIHTIPNFRIPAWAIENDIKFAENLGVKFHFNTDENFSVEKLKSEGYNNLVFTEYPEYDLRNQQQVEDFFTKEKPEFSRSHE